MARPAYFDTDRRAFVWLLLESQRLWAEHGICPELVASLGRMGGLLISLRQDYRGAFDITRHLLTVGEALGYEPQTSEARFLFAAYASHWFEPLETTVRHLTRACDVVVAAGDLSWAGYIHACMVSDLLEIAPTIDESQAAVEAGIALCRRTGNLHAAAQHTCELQLLRALRGQTRDAQSFDDEQFNELDFLARMDKLPYLEHTYVECRALYGLVMGDAGVLIPNAIQGMTMLGNLAGYYMTVYSHFFGAMARAWQLHGQQGLCVTGPSLEPAQHTGALVELDTGRAWLAARAADQPHNYLHMLRLVDAERAWALGDLWEAAAAFDEALGKARTCQRPWHRALINERAGLFHLARAMSHAGCALLTEARDIYKAWGATAKVQQMEREHSFLLAAGSERTQAVARIEGDHVATDPSNSVSSEALDLIGVLRASQALSSETNVERLTAKVIEVLAALSGATQVRVLSWNDGQWWLLAPVPGESSVRLAEAAARGLLPLSAFSYAERTGVALVVDDVAADDRFARDPYFAGVPDCSLLLVPIASQGAARGMLLLENRLGRAAFNARRLDAVMLVAGQLAVSLANAQLYENLELRVHERTRELEQTQAKLVATARRAGKAEIANNVLHNVGNVLNSVNVSASSVRRTVANSRLEGLSRAVALMNEHEDGLPAFMGQDSRGKAFRVYMNELVSALDAERRDALVDLDRLSSSVDHITYVVATQQSNAGPSSVLEMAQPQELLEEALRLSGEAIVRCGVTVVRRYADVPATPLDRPRLLQILVNLIADAAQAMEGIPFVARRLTVTTGIVQEEGALGLRITVRDEGEGIAQENLTRIFAHGFTTRQDGHGFGLHSSALAATEMGGRLVASSDGAGRGAVFAVELPLAAVGAVAARQDVTLR